MRSKTLALATALAAAIGALLMVSLGAQAQTASLTPRSVPDAAQPVLQALMLPAALALVDSTNPLLKAEQAQFAAAEGAQTDTNAPLRNNPHVPFNSRAAPSGLDLCCRHRQRRIDRIAAQCRDGRSPAGVLARGVAVASTERVGHGFRSFARAAG